MKQLAAGRDPDLEVLVGLELLGHQAQPERPEHLSVLQEPLRSERDQVELDDVRQSEQLVEPRLVAEVIQSELIPGRAHVGEHVQQRLVDELALEQLEHDPSGREAVGEPLEQELARDVDPCSPVSDETLETDLRQRVDRHPRARDLVVIDQRLLHVAVSIQQLIADDRLPAVEDRLPGKEDVAHRRDPSGPIDR